MQCGNCSYASLIFEQIIVSMEGWSFHYNVIEFYQYIVFSKIWSKQMIKKIWICDSYYIKNMKLVIFFNSKNTLIINPGTLIVISLKYFKNLSSSISATVFSFYLFSYPSFTKRLFDKTVIKKKQNISTNNKLENWPFM